MKDNQHIDEWLEQCNQATALLFAIVDPHSSLLPHRVFCQLDGQDGGPLLSPHQLVNAEDGPWLLPVNEAFLQWWKEGDHAQSGVLIATQTPKNARAHFASLFEAILQGERVFFPFYRPEYLAPMLPRMHPEEINLLLAGDSVLLLHNHQWQSYHSKVNKAQSLQEGPWWVVKSHHVDLSPNLPLMAYNIESWLWQHQPALMLKRIETEQPDFQQLFQQHFHELDEVKPLTLRLIRAALKTTMVDRVSDITLPTEEDELLFALKQAFSQIQGGVFNGSV